VAPLLSLVGLPAMMPATWVPWPPAESVSVSTEVGTFTTWQAASNGSQRTLLFETTTEEPSFSVR
jgi:hypothetical protein